MDRRIMYSPLENGFYEAPFTIYEAAQPEESTFETLLGDIIKLPKYWTINEEGIPITGNQQTAEEEQKQELMINTNNPETPVETQQQTHARTSFKSGKPSKSEKEYIEQYAGYAMEQMKKYGIPASITLAQGLVESAHGTSKLAIGANNHFGIKGTYNGQYQLANDDLPNEKFRKYDNPLQSFEDHSRLLRGRRYQQYVGNLALDDYRGWAKGLKRAGYATAPNYANAIIDKIEKLGLQKYDKLVLQES